MITIQAICPVCDVLFDARSILAVYCSMNCKCRAAYYRRQGRQVPKVKRVDPKPIRPQVIQPAIVETTSELVNQAWGFPVSHGGIEQRQWRGTDIQRRSRDGYVNATAMCSAGGKRWNHYVTNDRTSEYLQALSRSAGIPADRLVASVVTGPNELRGTWVHPRLAVDLARWISPAFAVWMDGWFLESLQRPTPQAQPGGYTLAPGITIKAKSMEDARLIWYDAIWRAVVKGTQDLYVFAEG